MTSLSQKMLSLPSSYTAALEPYLPAFTSPASHSTLAFPHLTLTYATSLDSTIALRRNTPTTISSTITKSMTHFLRTRHSAIVIGANTAIADNPRLNSRWATAALASQPQPWILDPSGRWLAGFATPAGAERNIMREARAGRGRGPIVVVHAALLETERASASLVAFRALGGDVVALARYEGRNDGVDWEEVLGEMGRRGVHSLMVEGGACVIHDLLRTRNRRFVTSVVVTIAPTYLGAGGVVVAPERDCDKDKVLRLRQVAWVPMGEDVVLAGLM